MSSHRFDIQPIANSNRGPVYEVRFRGETLIPRTAKPAADACRALQALGLTGQAEMWGDDKHRMTFPNLERAALFTTTEGEMSGPKIIKYVPFNRGAFES